MMKLQKIQSLHQSEVSSLIRDKEVLANNIMKMEELVEKYKKDFKVNENERITLYRDLKTLQQQVEKQNKIMSVLETIKTQLLSDIKDLTKKIENLNNELCCHEDKEAEMKTRITELTNKLSQQVDIANAAIFDRKMYCQHYKEARENSDLLKQKNDILDNYVNELKESFENQNHEVQHWENKWKQLDLQHKKIMTKLINKESECDALSAENQHLEEQVRVHIHSISLKEKEIESSLRKLNQVTQECMMLRSQLQIQNKKVQEYDEKLKQQESIIINEKEQYTNLENSAKLLHLEILRLTGEKNALICRVNDLEKLKQSFTYAKQELHKERFKNSALENAMHQPRNIHRWRMLKGTDPEKYKLIENYQTVQKQLLKKSIEGQKKDEKLSSMNKLVEQLKSMTTRNKHFESRYMHDINQKQILKEKNDKIKNLTFEVNMYESYMSSYQAEIVCLKEELKQYKVNQFFKKKKIVPE